MPPIAFDLSRLISRATRRTPTGIDRIELAYARHLLTTAHDLCFAASTPWGRLGLLPGSSTREFVETVAAVWRGDPVRRHPWQLAHRLRIGPGLRGPGALYRRLRAASAKPVYLLASHHHLEQESTIARLKERGGARFVCVIHDLIPIEFPKYVRPHQDRVHLRRVATAAALADAVIVASRTTRDALQPYLDRAGRAPAVLVAPFGASLPEPVAPATATGPPYFVCVGTIEPRKNQLLLVNLWRQIAAGADNAAPRLVLIGRRGWGADSAFKRLELVPGLRGLATRRDEASDAEVARLLKGARALLLPTFAEGFGLPLVEALVLGVPVLCSGIPALREHGGAVPEYLDPRDASSWRQAVLDYAAARSTRREAQLQRLARWRPPSWQSHFDAVERLLVELAERSD
ncbi:MAG TPA: glycosyltransferase family 1 protein [Stellaceae bacterium]|jgi:glycosyltransferase involved in cell wall biosynthesis